MIEPDADLIPDNHVIVLFGATGDLAKRKLLPGLFHLSEAGLLPRHYRVIGTGRGQMTNDEFQNMALEAVDEFGRHEPSAKAWKAFLSHFVYASLADAGALTAAVDDAEALLAVHGPVRRLFYLSVPPQAAEGIVREIGAAGLHERARIVMEKPFGHDLASAKSLDDAVHEVFDESDVYRIDHFLGKETVQNIIALRFANPLFEVVWNREHVDYVQIDVPERIGLEGRAGFYESTGAFRDMVVTHLLQVLGFVAMESPDSMEPDQLVHETVRVFRAVAPMDPQDVVYGQYEGYRDEPNVAADSQTETFVAARVFIHNERWEGVPFYLRTGKALAAKASVVTLGFRAPLSGPFCTEESAFRRELVIDLSEPGSISTEFLVKQPGPEMVLKPAPFAFHYEDSFVTSKQLEAYERLLHDAMLGDGTLFTRADGVEALWAAVDSVIQNPPQVHSYEQGGWGPEAAHRLIAPHHWHLPVVERAVVGARS